jgi:hypothetical protein
MTHQEMEQATRRWKGSPDHMKPEKYNIGLFTKFAIALVTVVLFAFPADARKRIPPSSMPELSTVWVGWADVLHYFRLELHSDGTGLCAIYERPRSSSRLYEITKWTLQGYNIEMMLKAIDDDAPPVTMKGTAVSSYLQLQLGDGRRKGWRAKATFEREQVIESAMESAKRRMEAYSKSGLAR